RDLVENRDVVLDDGGLADHDSRAMIDQNTRSNLRGRVDVDGEDFRAALLEMRREEQALFVPEPMRDAMALQGMKALEVQKRRQKTPRSRGASADPQQIVADCAPDLRGAREGFVEQVTEQHRRQVVGRQAAREQQPESI